MVGSTHQGWFCYALFREPASAIREMKQVAVTMKSGKIYAGFVISNIDPSYDRKYLQILPISSGHRGMETQQVTFTTDYAKVYAQMVQEDNTFALTGPRDFLHVLPVSEIASASLFDPDAYTRFNAGDPEVESPTTQRRLPKILGRLGSLLARGRLIKSGVGRMGGRAR